MPILEQFTGPSNRQSSPAVSVEETRNWVPESGDATNARPKVSWSLQPIPPALEPFVQCGTGPIRAVFAQDGRAFCVSGAFFYEFFGSQTAIVRGAVQQDDNPATISSNGTAGYQLLVTSGGQGYIFDLEDDTLTEITDDAFPTFALSALFFDGYFIALDGITGAFVLSTLEDGLTWNSLDFGLVSQFSDTVIGMTRTHDNLMLLGTQNAQAWYNSGAANFPFAPVAGGIIEHGIAAPFSAVEVDNTLFYLGQDNNGAGAVWKLNGYTPQEISTQAMRVKIAGLTADPRALSRSIGFSFNWQRHLFYAVLIPGLDCILLYDIATDQWVEWSLWNAAHWHWEPQVPRCHAFGFNRNLFGDRQSGTIYTFNPTRGSDLIVWTGPLP